MGVRMQEINKYRIQAKVQIEERERMEFSRSKSRLQFAIRTGARKGLFFGLYVAIGSCFVHAIEWILSPVSSSEIFIRPSRIASMCVVVLVTIVVMVVLQWFRWGKLRE